MRCVRCVRRGSCRSCAAMPPNDVSTSSTPLPDAATAARCRRSSVTTACHTAMRSEPFDTTDAQRATKTRRRTISRYCLFAGHMLSD